VTPDVGWYALGATILLAFVGWLFRTPKEASVEIATRLASLESKVATMAETYAGIHARHDETMRGMTASQQTLTAALDRLTNRMDVVHEALLFLKSDGNGETRRRG
jgi:uncharacterized coiled-coil protein SlyX